MVERAKYGSLKTLTDKQFKEHKAEITQRWRETHPDEVKAYNRASYLYRRKHPSHPAVCKICGKDFLGYRKGARICPKCLKKRKRQ